MKSLFRLILLGIQRKAVKTPVFIVGSSHSGTSIMLRILSEHPELYALKKETRLFFNQNRKIISILGNWAIKVKMTGKTGFIEKTPGHVFHIDKIFRYVPHAKIICMLRDGRDVVCSIKARHGGTRDGFKQGLGIWHDSYCVCKKYLSDSRFKLVKLESFVVNPKNTLQDICQFIGIEFYDCMLDYHKNTKLFYSNSTEPLENVLDGEGHLRNRNWQINKNIFDSSGKWKVNMSPQEKAEFKEKAGSMLIEYGYAEDENW